MADALIVELVSTVRRAAIGALEEELLAATADALLLDAPTEELDALPEELDALPEELASASRLEEEVLPESASSA